MKILAIDSSGRTATAALVEDEILIGEFTVNHGRTHSQTLLPMLDEMLQKAQVDISEIDMIAVAGGPGSFTGLRIGSATAKGLGLALDKPLVSVPTVDALAYNLWGCGTLVCPLMDARRSQVYTGLYAFREGGMEIIVPQCAVMIDEIMEKINESGRPVTFLGDGVPVFSERIETLCCVPHAYAPVHLNRQRAGAVAALAQQYAKEGRIETAAQHRPEYLRMPQAERERLERLQRA